MWEILPREWTLGSAIVLASIMAVVAGAFLIIITSLVRHAPPRF